MIGPTIGIASTNVRRIASNTSECYVQEPIPGVGGYNEMDSNADTCCLGRNFIILGYTQRVAEVYPFDANMPPTRVPIVSGATAYDVPGSNETIILVVNEGLYFGTKLDHSLFNPNQIRSYKIPVWDNPFDEMRPDMGIDLGSYFVPFQSKGTKIRFKSRSPTERELAECCHVNITSKIPWTPESVQLSEVISNEGDKDKMEDPRSNSFDLRQVDPLLDPSQWRQVSQIQAYDHRSLDVPVRRTFESSKRHPRASAEELSERWGISVERARATLKATLQRSTRSAILPLARRYRADRMYDRPRLSGKFSTDTAYFKCKSIRGKTASQVYFHKCGFYKTYHIERVNDAQIGPTLPRFISDFGIPEKLTMDGAAVQTGRKTTFMDTIRRATIDYHVSGPYRPEENPAEGGIRELKQRFYRLMIKHGIPKRLWCFVLDYVVDVSNVTVNYSKYSDGRVPIEIITGITPDISEYLDFTIYCWVYYRSDGGLGENYIGRWLGVSHRVGPLMTYWVLPNSGIPISTDTVQAITQEELQTDVVKAQMNMWTEGTKKILDAKSSHVSWAKEEIPQSKVFDYENEEEDFLRNFNMSISPDDIQIEDETSEERRDHLDAPNYVGMQVGLPRGAEGELERATVRRRIEDSEGRPSGVARSNPLIDTRRYEVEYEDGNTEVLSEGE